MPFVSFLLMVFSGLYYFGAVLLLIGVTRIPRMAGGYLRELFPRNVGGSSVTQPRRNR